jgi:flagellar motor switch protein FliG
MVERVMSSMMSMQSDFGGQMNGPMKAAMWILSVDDSTAAEVLASLDETELKVLYAAAQRVERATSDELSAIHAELTNAIERPGLRLNGKAAYFRQLAERSLQRNITRAVFGGEEAPPKPTANPTIAEADPEALATLLAQEHPQVVAAVVARLEPKRAAAVLKAMPQDSLKGVVSRLARIKTIAAPALEEAERLLASELPARETRDAELDGTRVAALLLNQLEGDEAEAILASISEETPDVAGSVRRAMFTFDDLARLDKKGIQMLLKSVDNQQLLIALKTASEDMRAKIFDGLSKRAAEMMKDDLEMLGPQRVTVVEEAQQSIVAVAMKLRQEGKLNVDMGDGEGTA